MYVEYQHNNISIVFFKILSISYFIICYGCLSLVSTTFFHFSQRFIFSVSVYTIFSILISYLHHLYLILCLCYNHIFADLYFPTFFFSILHTIFHLSIPVYSPPFLLSFLSTHFLSSIQTTFPEYSTREFSVRRRYREFVWLREHLKQKLIEKPKAIKFGELFPLPGDTFSSLLGKGIHTTPPSI